MLTDKHRVLISRLAVPLAALAIIAPCIAPALGDNVDSLVSWAEKTTPMSWQRGSLHTTSTAVVDHFGHVPYELWMKRGQNGLGYPGKDLPTAGVGSSWVYDPDHHIAGGTQYNDDGGWDDLLTYVSAPPSKLPSRDLSNVTSARGLHLGMTVQDAVHDLGVSEAAVQRIDGHHTAVSVWRSCGSKHLCGAQAAKAGISGYFAMVVFRDGRAVYIQEGVDGMDGG